MHLAMVDMKFLCVSSTSCESSCISSVFQDCDSALSTAMFASWTGWTSVHSSCVSQPPSQQQCKTHWVVAPPLNQTGTFVPGFQSCIMPPPSAPLVAQRSGHCVQCSEEAMEVKGGGGGAEESRGKSLWLLVFWNNFQLDKHNLLPISLNPLFAVWKNVQLVFPPLPSHTRWNQERSLQSPAET